MQHSGLLPDLLLVLTLAVVVVWLFSRWKQPTIVGLLVTGVLAGPSGLRLIADPAAVQDLAEVGVVLLLFSIGLEMSLTELFRSARLVFAGGALQVGLCAALVGGLARWTGATVPAALTLGGVVALSSTAVVTKLLSDAGQLESPQGRAGFAVLIFQDLCVLPMTALLPVLSASGSPDLTIIARTLGTALALVGVLVAVVRYVVPRLLEAIVRTRSSELFVLGTLLISLGTAWAGSKLGLSTALGAFLAGLVVAGSPYSHHALAQVLPFKNAFNSLFFVSVGMLVDLPFTLAHAPQVAGLLAAVVVLKALGAALALALVGAGARTAVATALTLAQVGEFSLVLAKLAGDAGALDASSLKLLMPVAVLSLLSTPLLVGWAERAGALAARLTGERAPDSDQVDHEEGHVIIVGFGLNGRNLARVLKTVGVPYEVLELNGATVARLRADGEPIHFGDASSPATLEHLGVRRARELVFAISDPAATRRAVKLARELAPGLKIVVRTRYTTELEGLYECGADLVVTDEMEASLRLVSVVLAHCEVPLWVRSSLVEEILADHYGGLVPDELEAVPGSAPRLAGVESRTIVLPAAAPAAGRSLADLSLRASTGATCLSVLRGGDMHANPGPDLVLAAGDRVGLFGDPAAVARAVCLLLEGEAALAAQGPRRRSSDR